MAEFEGPFGAATPLEFAVAAEPRTGSTNHSGGGASGGGEAHLERLLAEVDAHSAGTHEEHEHDADAKAEALERPVRSPKGETLRLVATIVKSFIGSGVLFLPKAFQNGGWLFSAAVMVAMAAVTQVTIMRLVECRQRVAGSYSYVGFKAFGRRAQVAVDVALVLSQAGFCCVYVVFIARNLLQLVNVNSCWVPATSLWVFMLVEFVLLTPLTWIRRIATFGWTSLAANVFIAGGLLGILAYALTEWAEAEGRLTVVMMNTADFPLFLGTAVYAYEGIGMVVPIFDSLSVEGQRRYPYTLTFTLLAIAAVYITVGMVPYLYVDGVAHAVLQDAITLNLPRQAWAYCIVVAYCVALVFSYPLMLFPAVKILERGVGPYLWSAAPSAHWRRNGFRAAIVAVTVLVSYVGASQLNNMVALVGCFCCTPLMLIFPAAFHYKLVRGTLWQRVSNVAICVLGLAVFVFSTYQAIATWTIATVDACLLTPPAAGGGGGGGNVTQPAP